MWRLTDSEVSSFSASERIHATRYPDAASRQSIRGNREYDILEHDILLNTTQTVLCLPGVAIHQTASYRLLTSNQMAPGIIYYPGFPLWILVHQRQEPPPFREGRMSGVTSVLLYSRLGCHGIFRPPLRHGSTTDLRIPRIFYNQQLSSTLAIFGVSL